MVLLARLKRDTYRDSVELMRLSAEVGRRPGLRQFSAMMATPANLDLLAAAGLLRGGLEGARPNDLCLAAEADDQGLAEQALSAAEALLEATRGRDGSLASGAIASARSLRGALATRPELNLALISVPGEYAATEARRALRAGLHVMMFSDNVPLEQEVALKEEAERLGLLCMGPDCGTALIGGLPLGFANRVRRGRIGLVGASGTGLQAVTCGIHQLGEGVSHALGSGGRDLSAVVGGRATLAALDALGTDSSTDVLVIIAKPGDGAIEARILQRASGLGKPFVAHFLGHAAPPAELAPGSAWAGSLEETARAAVALARGEPAWEAVDEAAIEAEARAVAAASGRGGLAGLFTGGTLAAEAARFLTDALAPRLSRSPTADAGGRQQGEVLRLGQHVIVDLGDDVFTRGKPHPIIDPATRAAAIESAVKAGATVILLDLVLGFGAPPDPAGALAPTLERARAQAGARGSRLEVLVAVVGTELDPQPASEQRERLRSAGARVYDSPTQAARVAAAVAALLEAPSVA